MIANQSPVARLNKAALFNWLRYEPHPGQICVHESDARFRVLVCGTRWGKTTLGAMEAACALLQPRESSLGWLVAPTSDLTRLTMDRVRIALLEHMRTRVLEDDTRGGRVVVRNLGGGQSQLRCMSTDNPTALLGEAVDWVILDEASKVREGVWDAYLAPRLVDRVGRALILSTPRSVDSWLFRAWHRGQKGRDAEYESWRGPTADNPHVRAEVIAAERRRLPGEVFAQEYLARFAGEDALPCDMCSGPSESVPGLLVTLDHAKTPRCTDCGCEVDDRGQTVVGRSASGARQFAVIDGGTGLAKKLAADERFDVEGLRFSKVLRAGQPTP